MRTVSDFFKRITAAQWLGAVIAVLTLIFVLTNRQHTRVTIYGLGVEGPTWLILLVVLLIGWVTGILMGRSRYRHKQ